MIIRYDPAGRVRPDGMFILFGECRAKSVIWEEGYAVVECEDGRVVRPRSFSIFHLDVDEKRKYSVSGESVTYMFDTDMWGVMPVQYDNARPFIALSGDRRSINRALMIYTSNTLSQFVSKYIRRVHVSVACRNSRGEEYIGELLSTIDTCSYKADWFIVV